MKFYSYILAMKKEIFFVLTIMIAWIGMLLWTFFWWSGENPEIKEESTWFIEQIVETWSSEWTSEELPVDEKEWTWIVEINENIEINVMMPHYFYTAWWKDFAQDLYEEKNVYMNFIFMDNLNDYRDAIIDEWFTDADLALIPYDWMEYIKPKTFSFQKNVDTDFDKMVSSVINNSDISFLPFAADPMVMYTLTWNEIQTNFSNMLDFVYDDWTPTKSLSFPIFYWVTPTRISRYSSIRSHALFYYISWC